MDRRNGSEPWSYETKIQNRLIVFKIPKTENSNFHSMSWGKKLKVKHMPIDSAPRPLDWPCWLPSLIVLSYFPKIQGHCLKSLQIADVWFSTVWSTCWNASIDDGSTRLDFLWGASHHALAHLWLLIHENGRPLTSTPALPC